MVSSGYTTADIAAMTASQIVGHITAIKAAQGEQIAAQAAANITSQFGKRAADGGVDV